MTDILKKKPVLKKEKLLLKQADELAKKRAKEEEIERIVFQREEEKLRKKREERKRFEIEDQEHVLRCVQLKDNKEYFEKLENKIRELKIVKRNENGWRELISCKLFDRIVAWINEYISIWQEEELESKSMELVKLKCLQSMDMINFLDKIIDDPIGISKISNWIECRSDLKDMVFEKLDYATYWILRNIEKQMDYIDFETMNFKEINDNFKLLLWTVLQKEKSQLQNEKLITVCNFDECDVSIQLPKSFYKISLAVRCLWLKFDYLSNDCRTFQSPKLDLTNLLEYNLNVRLRKQKLRLEQDEEDCRLQIEKDKRKRLISKLKYLLPSSNSSNALKNLSDPMGEVAESEQDVQETTDSDKIKKAKENLHEEYIAPLKRTISQTLREEEKTEMEILQHQLEVVNLFPNEVNMRRYTILGGLYSLELLKQPSQPKILSDGSLLTYLIGPHSLQRWKYLEQIEPSLVGQVLAKHPAEDEDDAGENAEIRLLSKFVLVSIKIPTNILWFDVPMPVHWDDEKKFWSTEYIYDTKFSEEKQILTFRAGKMTIFGLAVPRYSNLPFQTWELKSRMTENSEILLTITAATLGLEFSIRPGKVCLIQVQNGEVTALEHLIGIYFEPAELIRIMKTEGANIFPDPDTFLYLENVPNKHMVTERHLYRCISMTCLCYNYSWSRWNLNSGFKSFVIQMKELNSNNSSTENELLLVTAERAVIVDCTEANQKFSSVGVEGIGFYSDLYSLALDRLTETSKHLIRCIDTDLSETVFFLLCKTRILSFS